MGVGKDEGGDKGDVNDGDDTSDGASCAWRGEEEQDYLRWI